MPPSEAPITGITVHRQPEGDPCLADGHVTFSGGPMAEFRLFHDNAVELKDHHTGDPIAVASHQDAVRQLVGKLLVATDIDRVQSRFFGPVEIRKAEKKVREFMELIGEARVDREQRERHAQAVAAIPEPGM